MQQRMAMVLGLVLVAASTAPAGRYEQFTAKAAEGKTMDVAAATFYGTENHEEFVAAGQLADGRIVAFGNVWGPGVRVSGRHTVIGQGRRQGLEATDSRGRLRHDNPDIAGVVVTYVPDLSRIERILHFDWGVASISTGTVSPDGETVLIAGRCTDAIDTVAASFERANERPLPIHRRRAEGPGTGPYRYGDAEVPGHTYILRIGRNGEPWLWVFEGQRTPPPHLWTDRAGNVYFQVDGLKRISADGATLTALTDRGTSDGKVGVRTVDPADGSFYLGGDRNTSTGREPWRQPFLYAYSPDGEKRWSVWEWNSRLVGTDQYRLVSDSSVRAADVAPDGDIVVGGWSDGGNSVFTRQPTDLDRSTPAGGWGMSAWGMKNANSLGWLLRLDPQTKAVTAWSLWVSYVPQDYHDAKYRGAPNFANIHQVEVLPTGEVGFCGRAATGLIQTPNAFWTYPADGQRFGGSYAACFTGDFSDLLFSSYLPAYEDVAIAPAPHTGGLIVVGRSRGRDERMGASPAVNAEQPRFGGATDGHILLLKRPE